MSRPNSYLGSVSDLMAGLMIVFLFIAISYMVDIKSKEGKAQIRADQLAGALVATKEAKELADAEKEKSDTLNDELHGQKQTLLNQTKTLENQKRQLALTNETIKEIAVTYSQLQGALYNELLAEFEFYLPLWNATLEKDNTIRFNEPEVLFSTGDAEIKQRFKVILGVFYPKYLKIVYQKKFRNEIEELRIEGHTSSIWKDSASTSSRYLKNAALSQKRALAVLEYCFSLEQTRTYQDLLIRDLRGNGLSFARPILAANGKEDVNKSQRVEFRVITKTQDRILRILESSKKQNKPTP